LGCEVYPPSLLEGNNHLTFEIAQKHTLTAANCRSTFQQQLSDIEHLLKRFNNFLYRFYGI